MGKKIWLVMWAGLFLWLCPGARAAEWKYLGQTPDASYYYDQANIVRQGDVVRLWMKAVYSREGKKKEEGQAEGQIWNVIDSRALEEFNCRDKSNYPDALVIYSLEGKAVISDSRERGRDFALPDSILTNLCKLLRKPGEDFPRDPVRVSNPDPRAPDISRTNWG